MGSYTIHRAPHVIKIKTFWEGREEVFDSNEMYITLESETDLNLQFNVSFKYDRNAVIKFGQA